MASIYILALCAVLNNQIQWDRCRSAPGSEMIFATVGQCVTARTLYAYDFAGITPDKTQCHYGAAGNVVCPMVQWKTRFTGPFNETATCLQKDVPAFHPLP